MRFKKTEVCQTCSRLKNVCQVCLLDLEYGLPTQVRDAALNIKDDLPHSDVNKQYYVQNIENESGNIDPTTPADAVGKSVAPSDLLVKLARPSPYYKRNRPRICSFWVKGKCNRGEQCPYRHEKPTNPDDPLADQNIRDRYYGVNDPVADKLMRRAAAMPKLEPPEDKSITTLYIGNLGDILTEKQLRDHFYQYGEIRSITMIPRRQYAFIQYRQRCAAEAAAENTFNKLILNGRRLTIKWGRSRDGETAETTREILAPVPGLPGALPPPPYSMGSNFFNFQTSPGMMPPIMIPPVAPQFMFPPQMTATATTATPIFPPGTTPIHYPSQNPSRMGTSQGIGKPWPEE